MILQKNASKPIPGPKLTKGLLKCSTSKPRTDSSDYTLSEKNNLIEDTNIPSIDNPAQDMLDKLDKKERRKENLPSKKPVPLMVSVASDSMN